MGFLFDVTEYDRAPQTGQILANDVPAHLPSLTPRPSGVVPALPIVLWDRAVEAKPGRGAPYGLRLWIEAILSVPVSDRFGKRTISIPFGQMVKALFNRYRRDQFPALSFRPFGLSTIWVYRGVNGGLKASGFRSWFGIDRIAGMPMKATWSSKYNCRPAAAPAHSSTNLI